jgi:16S rRNA (guanine1207-N2)-methyltransferase
MISANIKGVDLRFETADGLFSPKNVDKGTLAMLSVIDFVPDDKVLDLGCGYGAVGILAAKLVGPEHVTMVDVDELAVGAAKRNAVLNEVQGIDIRQSDGLASVTANDYTLIISHPPYHADFSVAKSFIEKGFNRLRIGGRLYMVTKRKEWYKNKLIAIFGGVKIWEIDDYFVFMSVKKGASYAGGKKRK